MTGQAQPGRGRAAPAPEAAEGVADNAPPRAVRWSVVLVWFMRLVALLWITKGLAAWAAILGIGSGAVPFEVRPVGYQTTAIYFAVIDLVAAVGLWLATTWGGVLWLLAIMSHLILAFFFPLYVPGGALLTALFAAFILGYLTISWLAAGEGA
jgi:hypothetical protein